MPTYNEIIVKNNDWKMQSSIDSNPPVYSQSGDSECGGDGGRRLGSTSSNISFSNNDICRICHCEADNQNPLLAPCYCSGSLKYVHQACLQQWLTASETRSCELCKFNFIMHTKIKPFNEWRRLEMSGVERRRLCCAVLFHCVAALCVIWSLFVLIDRATEEVQRGLIDWPFWTKLVVVAVGFTGGAVFMYIQCRQYLHLCYRWRAHNRIILIQNAPEKSVAPPSPTFRVSIRPSTAVSLANNNRQHTSFSINRPSQVIANIENNQFNNLSHSIIEPSLPAPSPLPSCKQQQTIIHDLQQQQTNGIGSPSNTISSSQVPCPSSSQIAVINTNVISKHQQHSAPSMENSYLFGSRNGIETMVMTPLSAGLTSADVNNYDRIIGTGCLHHSYNIIRSEVQSKSSNESQLQNDVKEDDSYHKHQSNSSILDPLEVDIQEMLALDSQNSKRVYGGKNSMTSLHDFILSRNNFEKNKSVFKSLPNLSSSNEKLLP